ncbi:terminase family protein [Dysgonomonas alginatilytica]|uniref:Terminase family protein n=1 Tax=Dysgonomonas alginatilytica TaxID=1605892 RepID=A0A2V3PTK5_9BACT|nr:terminase family protein [Dysgonomonas alginatilytica]PXV66861.1 terminase family protein [Dysgonomonas alginatilytica]
MENITQLDYIFPEPVYTLDYINQLRELDSPLNIIAQKGSQELFLMCEADICIFGGKRGGSKTYSLLLEALPDIRNANFYASLLRKEKDDSRKTGGIVDKSDGIYSQYGIYNKSQQDMTWNFHSGGKLKFDYYSDTFEDFKKRFQGLELSFVGVDEITHMPYEYFKYLLTSNRNAHNIKNRFRGTCNPDPDSWVATFIDWWIAEDGIPIPERNGVLRYCFMYGDTVNEIYWGDSKQEVYEQAKERIDKLWRKEYEQFGNKEDMFIKSVTFIEGKLEENIKLMKSDPNYLGNLANQSDEQVSRDLGGNWKFKTAGFGLITFEDMENFFANSYHNEGLRCVTCDVAFEGGDKCVMWYWEGYHARDVRVISVDAKKTVAYAKDFCKLHGVLEENFCYDVNGLGQVFKGFMPRARPFNNKEMPTNGDRAMFENLKAECAYKFVQRMKARGYSIEASLLKQKFSGKNYKNVSLENILLKERKAVAQDDTDPDKNWRLISKVEMKKVIGRSPDFMESFFMREYFEVKNPKAIRKNVWML